MSKTTFSMFLSSKVNCKLELHIHTFTSWQWLAHLKHRSNIDADARKHHLYNNVNVVTNRVMSTHSFAVSNQTSICRLHGIEVSTQRGGDRLFRTWYS